MNTNDLQKGLETVNNITKIFSNVTDPNKNPPEKKSQYKGGDSTNQPHTQTVEVKVGDQGNDNKKPVILKEKTETHIHKHFPDNRALSPEECEIEKMRLTLEYQEKDKEREHQIFLDNRAREEAKEAEEKARERFEKEEERRKKRDKRMLIVGSILAGVGLVGTGYYLYTDSRRNRAAESALRQQERMRLEVPKMIETEGEVK